MSKKASFWLTLTPVILSLILALIILILLHPLPSRIPLFYSLPWGENQLATHEQFLIIPSSIILITLLNFTFSSGLHHQQTFFKKLLLFSSILCTLILTLTFAKIILNFI